MMFYTHPEVARLWVDVVVSISDLGVGKFGK
jgi:hypothetical protein